ncbi:arabinan endo-1,5-alpha-L-arabinosidase [Alkalitalea saponilacus]|uniref:Arabinan endo-1,5-alpha-L-arabinosidase n=1 Tax=Alkalitalea saponilacus TaxID=889453 RepID=A0A1T5HSR8_9BACT|nr:arabinan endo-1,5-alpha-L-arabinosidase [Alkalitalea saponilacus]ASB47731.1 arabinan endo-1,5-alpha-L-arabinosidase [Alkalitalea saponilacus]SKC23662.1 arabinan endo-1,5-alpha-L-arabinosidase [Alkalitalea saponilacus]
MRAYLKLLVLSSLIFTIGCSDDDDLIPNGDETGNQQEFRGPRYSDDYSMISSWSSRNSWNLANVHDPTVVKDGDYFYMYQTDASYGNVHVGHGHFPVRRSRDLVNWEFYGMAFDHVPLWVKDSLNNMRSRMDPPLPAIENPEYGFWAPHISKVGDEFRMYYSIVVINPIVGNNSDYSWTERAFIGLAVSRDLASNLWEDRGMVVCSEPDGLETYSRTGPHDWSGYFQFNAIDPSFIVTPEGEHWLIYGSWHTGIAAVQLNPETGKPDSWNSLEDYGVRIAGRGNLATNRWQALEAPEIVYNEETGYYYLFLAYDELSVAYNTRVARSKSITGPYLGIDGGNVTEGAECWPMLTHPYAFSGHHGWVGFAHCSVFRDPDTGQWFYASQARLPENLPGVNASNAIMMGHVREIEWTSDGWPVVMPQRYAAVPETDINKEDLVGRYDVIIKSYDYQKIQNSRTAEFHSDGRVTGALSGTWNFDEEKKRLTIGNLELIVKDAWDWEASPRKTTITFSGLTSDGRPVWGKLRE